MTMHNAQHLVPLSTWEGHRPSVNLSPLPGSLGRIDRPAQSYVACKGDYALLFQCNTLPQNAVHMCLLEWFMFNSVLNVPFFLFIVLMFACISVILFECYALSSVSDSLLLAYLPTLTQCVVPT